MNFPAAFPDVSPQINFSFPNIITSALAMQVINVRMTAIPGNRNSGWYEGIRVASMIRKKITRKYGSGINISERCDKSVQMKTKEGPPFPLLPIRLCIQHALRLPGCALHTLPAQDMAHWEEKYPQTQSHNRAKNTCAIQCP